MDDEDLAAIATGRGAQIIPKLELLFKYDREWLGLGFLSRDRTKSNKYIIENELYANPEFSEEVATGVESTPFQIMLDVGILGLIIHVAFLFGLWFIIRRLPDSGFFVSVMVVFIVAGISGFSGLIRIGGELWASLAWAACVLASKRQLAGFDLPAVNHSPKTVDKTRGQWTAHAKMN